MATIHFHVESKLPAAAVLAGITDFGSGRSSIWPNVDRQHFKVHGKGPGWAEVTEGSSVAGGVWERERYTWDEAKGIVDVETIDSNTWATGSRWSYRLVPNKGGTRVDVTVVRKPKGTKGSLIAFGLALVGRAMLRTQMEQALRRMSKAGTTGA
ncbi:MAG TPA: SRPBCC family protein [Candidatus Dormibacteraeota bacterium]|nr:SRPBCC family protein [Candidatus Dormibacteraeota bacterium]